MCGVFGLVGVGSESRNRSDLKRLIEKFYLLSETRGRDAAGLALQVGSNIEVLKRYKTASEFIKSSEYKVLIKNLDSDQASPIKILGHTRLATNGMTFLELNNQPVVSGKMVGVHNGIITNDEVLWAKKPHLKRKLEVDTELMLELFQDNFNKSDSVHEMLKSSFEEFEGNISCGVISTQFEEMIVATNNGSIYYAVSSDYFVFASEKLILNEFIGSLIEDPSQITQLNPGFYLTVRVDSGKIKVTSNKFKEAEGVTKLTSASYSLIDHTDRARKARENLRRCTKCVLPETFPFIKFDSLGVCNHCHSYSSVKVDSKKALESEISRLLQNKKTNSSGDCLFMLSGGRDSCYALHYAVKELGLKPVAYTYDWGMVTDIARRNAERMCGQLGVEHIIVSADIRQKRDNIRKNVMAWLKKPELGMVPIFMAGDKQFLYYGRKIREVNQLPFTMTSVSPYEKTGFKTGFAGVDEGAGFIYKIPLTSKAKFAGYYLAQFLKNPSYINLSMLDTLHGFWSAFLMKHDFVQLFQYEYWDEKKIVETLVSEYNWELDPEAGTSWRIGDGTAAFYNLIYYTLAGFTENDTFRSHQIREGVLSREQALKLLEIENQPRWKSLEWYASVVGFNLSEAVRIINHAPKLYLDN